MTLRERLLSVLGVWEGTYRHLTPLGQTIDTFSHRQEIRFENDTWYERIVYRPATPEEQVLDFTGRFEGDQLVMKDARFEGRAILIEDDLMLFPYRWLDDPTRKVVETVHFAMDVADGLKERVWQTYRRPESAKPSAGWQLERVTLIREKRRAHLEPAVWTDTAQDL